MEAEKNWCISSKSLTVSFGVKEEGLCRNPAERAGGGQLGNMEFVFAEVILTNSGTLPHATTQGKTMGKPS